MSLKFLESVALFIAKPNIWEVSLFRWWRKYHIFKDGFYFLSFTSVKILIFYFVLAIYQPMKDLIPVFRYHYFTSWCMMYLLFVNILARVSLSRLDISSRKSEIGHQLSVIFQTSSLSNCPYFLWLFKCSKTIRKIIILFK